MKKSEFLQGIRHGIPICLGYFSVSAAFGITAVRSGLPLWTAVLISLTNVTSAGQFAGVNLMVAGGSMIEIAMTTLIINIRYFLMSLSVSQKVESKMSMKKRLGIAYGITDEIFAVSMQQPRKLTASYMAGLILTVYASNDLYNSFRVSNAYYIPSVFNELGFPYCFCHQFTTYPVDRPEDFSKSEAAGWETGEQTGLGQDVSIIMVMNEAFSDITDQPMFNWTEETDPLPNLHALQNDPHAVSGHIVVPGFAGGTANTEFDVLTGMQTNALSATTTSAMMPSFRQ